MNKVIIYLSDEGEVISLHPAPEAAEMYGVEAIALKDVPHGKAFKIVDASEVPDVIDPSTLTDGVGGNFTSFE